MNKNKKQLNEAKAQRLAVEARIEQLIQPQIDKASARFQDLLLKLDELCAEHGFSAQLVSVGFEPTIDEQPVGFMAFAAHSLDAHPDDLASMMEATVFMVDKTLHNVATDVLTTPTFNPPTANA